MYQSALKASAINSNLNTEPGCSCRQAAVPMQQGAGLLGLPMLNARSLFGAEQPFEQRDQYGFDAFGYANTSASRCSRS